MLLRPGATLLLAAALLSVARADDDAIPTFLEGNPSAERWDPAVVALRRDEPEAARKLLAFAAHDEHPLEMRTKAILIAGAIDDREDAPAAIAALARGDTAVVASEAAGRARGRAAILARFDAALARGEVEPDELGAPVRELLALALDPAFDPAGKRRVGLVRLVLPLARRAGADPLPLLVQIAATRGPAQSDVRFLALEILEERGSRIDLARALAAIVDDPDPHLRLRALDDMPRVADDDALEVFARLALPPEASLDRRTHAVEGLGRTRAAAAAPWIENVLREAVPITEDRLRAEALVALARSGGRPAVDVAGRLVDFLGVGSTAAQERAVDGLAELPPAACEGALGPRLRDPTPDDARARAAQAARALALRGLATDLAHLARAEACSLTARTAAVRALEVTGDPRDGAAALASVLAQAREGPEAASLRRAAALGLGAPALRGEAARSALALALGDETSLVRLAAIRALGAQGDPAAASPLLELLGKPDVPPRERVQAIRALDRLEVRDDATARSVATILDDEPTVELAVAASDFLAQAPRSVSVPALLRLLESTEASVRERAHAALLTRTHAAVQPELDPFDYDPSPRSTRAEREAAVKRWQEWWQMHRER